MADFVLVLVLDSTQVGFDHEHEQERTRYE
jgi:hypothetical protein